MTPLGFFRPSRDGYTLGADSTEVNVINGGTTELKTLLDDVSGQAHDGEVLAVLGTSGFGKSTLIDGLAKRISRNSLKGTMTLNGENLESRLLKLISAYVIRPLPDAHRGRNAHARVQALIDRLDLRDTAATIIGDKGHRGVSDGERRRVSIRMDIIHDPIILFLDEPTSGLDSTSSFMVVKVLQRIAQSGSIMIMTIHQPSYRIVKLLNHMIFISRGQTVYSRAPSGLPLFFSVFGHPIPENENWTEFALDLIRELECSPGGTKGLTEFNKSWQTTKKHPHTTTAASPDRLGLSLQDAIGASISRGKLVSSGTVTASDVASSAMSTYA
ncbi:hypothetical protein H6P81_006629 [Aristolochia fimbriata]|uniref:ABC transporter domain-containing protein n=1 Tax=Aristolochia fimbriata TaxID=158543 RepID=A0AAV7EXU3_ARIFI|nr:hypothetical protein H6P81_006629 [Aristolochia fimbriata]